jgi:hypothetical protein
VVRFDRGELVVAVEPGVEGRVPWARGERPAGAVEGQGGETVDVPAPGTRLTVRVVSLDLERERLGLAVEEGQPEAMGS